MKMFMAAHEQTMQQQQLQQQQFAQFMQQQATYNYQMLAMQHKAKLLRQKKGNPPGFNGDPGEDCALYVFDTEEYYSECKEEMHMDTPDFLEIAVSNLGPRAKVHYREWKMSLGSTPPTWTLYKAALLKRFSEADAQFKLLTKLHKLRWNGSQAEYTTEFLHLLSQFEGEMPEVIKRWFYQANIRAPTSSFVSQHIPKTLDDTIELAQRFEDTQPKTSDVNPPKPTDTKFSGDKKVNHRNSTPRDASPPANAKPPIICNRCGKPGHIAPKCSMKKGTAGAPKNA